MVRIKYWDRNFLLTVLEAKMLKIKPLERFGVCKGLGPVFKMLSGCFVLQRTNISSCDRRKRGRGDWLTPVSALLGCVVNITYKSPDVMTLFKALVLIRSFWQIASVHERKGIYPGDGSNGGKQRWFSVAPKGPK